jgi:long-chain acyl-CoA synthetase
LSGPRTIGDISAWRADIDADAEAVVDGYRRSTWAELADRTNCLANALACELSVGRGDRVAYVGESTMEAFDLCHAVPRLGALLVPLNDRLAPSELERIVGTVEPTVLVHDVEHADHAARLASVCGARRVGIGLDADVEDRYEDLVGAGDTQNRGVDVDPDSASSICFTSGTTGAPKGVLMRHRAQLEFARAQTVIEPILRGARHVFARPMSVAPGHRLAAWHGLNGGATVLLRRFSPAAFFATVEREQGTNVLLAPTMLRMLLDHGNVEGCDLSSLRTILYGGAPMPGDLLAEVLAFFRCDLVQGYGSSEAGQVLYLSASDHRLGRTGSHGRPVPGVDIEIRGEAGAAVGDEQVGHLCVRSQQLMAGYWRDAERTEAVLRDGWYATGDLATRMPDGTYRLVGRASDMIISGGFNVIPSEVEEVLAQHSAVRDVAVFGVPDRTWGEAVRAAVVLQPGATASASELVEWCRSALASFKKPRAIDFVGALPLTPTGKVDRRALARRALGDVSEPAGAPSTH